MLSSCPNRDRGGDVSGARASLGVGSKASGGLFALFCRANSALSSPTDGVVSGTEAVDSMMAREGAVTSPYRGRAGVRVDVTASQACMSCRVGQQGTNDEKCPKLRDRLARTDVYPTRPVQRRSVPENHSREKPLPSCRLPATASMPADVAISRASMVVPLTEPRTGIQFVARKKSDSRQRLPESNAARKSRTKNNGTLRSASVECQATILTFRAHTCISRPGPQPVC